MVSREPMLILSKTINDLFTHRIMYRWVGNNANPEMAWSFWVEHYKNETQARRDNKYAYQYPNGSIYYGLDPPEGVTPYVYHHLSAGANGAPCLPGG